MSTDAYVIVCLLGFAECLFKDDTDDNGRGFAECLLKDDTDDNGRKMTKALNDDIVQASPSNEMVDTCPTIAATAEEMARSRSTMSNPNNLPDNANGISVNDTVVHHER